MTSDKPERDKLLRSSSQPAIEDSGRLTREQLEIAVEHGTYGKVSEREYKLLATEALTLMDERDAAAASSNRWQQAALTTGDILERTEHERDEARAALLAYGENGTDIIATLRRENEALRELEREVRKHFRERGKLVRSWAGGMSAALNKLDASRKEQRDE